MDRETAFRDFLSMRGVEFEDRCLTCNGLGTDLYDSTSTWRQGIGGSAMTLDVCSVCWGSGNRRKHWPSHRRLLAAEWLLKRKEKSR